MMNIILNGEQHTIEQDANVLHLLDGLKLTNQAIAVAINRKIIPKPAWSSTFFNEQDVVDVVRAIGGG